MKNEGGSKSGGDWWKIRKSTRETRTLKAKREYPMGEGSWERKTNKGNSKKQEAESKTREGGIQEGEVKGQKVEKLTHPTIECFITGRAKGQCFKARRLNTKWNGFDPSFRN